MMDYDVTLMPVVSQMLILSHVRSIGVSNTAAKIRFTLLPMLTHYKGMLANCKQELEWLVC